MTSLILTHRRLSGLVAALLLTGSPTLYGQDEPAVEPESVTVEQLAAGQDTQAADFASRLAAHPGDSYSPQPPWTGPIVIPDIVRPHLLPMRMYNDPALPRPQVVNFLLPGLVELSESALRDGTDLEVREVAGLQLVRIAREHYADISATFPTLRSLLASDEHPKIRTVCALALAEGNDQSSAAELVHVSAESDVNDQKIIEGALIRWKAVAARDLWRSRVSGGAHTVVAVRLACEGLAAIGDTEFVPDLLKARRLSSQNFSKRMSISGALVRLDPVSALAEAKTILTGSQTDKLQAIELLDQSNPEAYELTGNLCEDGESGVAAAAWQQLLNRHPESLLTHLGSGRRHSDAGIREAAARVMALFPDGERLAWLQELISDRHLKVRNVARQMLVTVAGEHPEMRESIVGRAVDCLNPESDDWQGQEQSLVLLGQLRAAEYSGLCVPLLDSQRAEVCVAAAWLMHLFPDPAVREAVVGQVHRLEGRLKDSSVSVADPPHKLAYLYQYCGLMRVPELLPLYEEQFSKAAPGGADKRAAAMWAIGLLHEKNPVPGLVTRLEERVRDRGGMMPEGAPVRRISALALGLMRAISAEPTVREAYEVDSVPTLLPANAQWVLPLLGVPMPVDREPDRYAWGSWRLIPAVKKK